MQKKTVRRVGWLLLVLLQTAPFTFAQPVARADKKPVRTAEQSSKQVLRGEKIAQLHCVQCHGDNSGRLTGKRMTDVPRALGVIYSPNITRHPTAGIGSWSDEALIRFLRTGERPGGRLAPAMPRYPLMADEDLRAVVAWLRSDAFAVQPDENEAPKTRYSLPVRLVAGKLFKPLPEPQKPIVAPDTADRVALGRYLADGVVGCYSCHSASFRSLNPLEPSRSKGYYAGGNKLIGVDGKPVYSSNLTKDAASGIGQTYTRETFIRAVRQGIRHDGQVLQYPMTPHVTLTDAEAGAIYDYLQTLPAIGTKKRSH